MRISSWRWRATVAPALVLIGVLGAGVVGPTVQATSPPPTPTTCYGPVASCLSISPIVGGIHPTPTLGGGTAGGRSVTTRGDSISRTLTVSRSVYPPQCSGRGYRAAA